MKKAYESCGDFSLRQFAPVTLFNTSVEALVLQTLRTAITQGAFYPGQEIDESAIAKDLQISRMPVRQAMSALEIEGLVTKVPRKGVFVSVVDANDLKEIYTTRLVLEEATLREAINNYTDEDFAKMEENLNQPLSKIKTYVEFLEIDKEFHLSLCSPSKWQRAIKYIQQLRNCTAVYRAMRSPLPLEDLKLSFLDHRTIFEACKTRNADLAARLLKEHTLRTAPKVEEFKLAK
ncbi:MAG: GntR family transcriptional regulator [Cloacibacillus porcorum]|uniref:GntR family transcriptional regulator n=1 Tax=Cloacibacillus porcorum TaxID=1197717 RepID=UPI0023562167|nr:GntR family transcriptional regulator [Cloacibacillus porcorum]MCI5864858.1 GntR family transcriptional regulator [Cloacibacillus porcorum]MDD7649012.1 GntR family transcriptional regulator [Cloacibacillus porcorum]MDY4092251.1 GntR family transcriptional regulator [Cloacibacillus porcorum]